MRTTASVSKPQPSNPPQPQSKTQPQANTNVDPDQVPSGTDEKNVRILVNPEVDLSDVEIDELPNEKEEGTSGEEVVMAPEKVPTKISSVLESGIAFIRNIAPDIVDNLVVGETPIIPIAVEMIEWAETNVLAGKLTGQEKKRVVINILLWLVDHQEEVLGVTLGYDTEKMRDIVQHILPSVIDIIIAATKGKVLVNKFAKTAKTCFSICCPDL
jgi:hypothetical protein